MSLVECAENYALFRGTKQTQNCVGGTKFNFKDWAQKYKDYQGIDWSELQRQHKEFAGHTSTSLSKVFRGCLCFAKKLKNTEEVSLVEVAESAEVLTVKKELAAKTIRRKRSYFEKRVEELKINIVV